MEYIGFDNYKHVLNGRKIFLVCGNSFDKLPFSDYIYSLNVAKFSDFSSNPLYEEVCSGVEQFKSGNYDTILAVGGGSAIDVAKCIKFFSSMDKEKNYLEKNEVTDNIELIVIPTTAGSGSEATRYAVIYYDGIKQSIAHDSILPEITILEPAVLSSLPVYQKKCTLLDALCQGIESWWSVRSTKESRDFAERAIREICESWKRYIEGDEGMNEKVMFASNLAGKAINITSTTAAHAMSYKLTTMYRLPHGHAVAVCLPEVWDYMEKNCDRCIDIRGINYFKSMLRNIPVSVEWFRKLLDELKISNPVSYYRDNEIELLVKSVNLVRLKNTPVNLGQEEIRLLYERIIQ